jgi:subtilisin family serine protease
MLVSTLAVGCAKGLEAPVADGMLTEENGQVKRLSEAEAKSVCEAQFCEPNYIQSTNAQSSYWYKSWYKKPSKGLMGNKPVSDKLDYSRKLMGVTDAWKTTLGSRDVIVAVVDSGVDYDHQDLRRNIWVNAAEANGSQGVDDDGNGFVDDVHGYNFYASKANGNDEGDHGTHVAGIIGAQLNGLGTAGVAPRVKIMPLTFIGPTGSGSTLDAIKAINYAIDNGAQVISNSWGSTGKSMLLGKTLQRAMDKGILVVAAAGNAANENDVNPYYPASYPGVIAVASTDKWDRLSSFSNYGAENVMIAAPGSSIYSTLPSGAWGQMSGTSMAAPQVSGALALALSMKPEIQAETLKDKLCESSKKILTKSVKCGRMDVAALVADME